MNNRARHFVAALLLLLAPLAALAAGVEVLVKSMFPSDRFTVLDLTQNTFRRVNLPKPRLRRRCPATAPDIDVINTLDGFNLQPRLSIPFNGAIDVSSVDQRHRLPDQPRRARWPCGGSFGDRVGINQVVWDPATHTLHVESDELLDQHTRYALVVTGGVRDAERRAIRCGAASARPAPDAATTSE